MAHDYSGHEETVAPDQMALLTTLVSQLEKADAEVDRLDEELSAAKKVAQSLRENDIPSLMLAVGLKELTTADGLIVKMKEDVRASFFAKEPVRREPAFAWLRDNHHEGLVKNVVSVQFDKSQEGLATAFAEYCKKFDVPLNVEQKRDINHQTMLAFLREQLREGQPVPLELFGAQQFNTVRIEHKRKK